jgi:hypothetical protein
MSLQTSTAEVQESAVEPKKKKYFRTRLFIFSGMQRGRQRQDVMRATPDVFASTNCLVDDENFFFLHKSGPETFCLFSPRWIRFYYLPQSKYDKEEGLYVLLKFLKKTHVVLLFCIRLTIKKNNNNNKM